MPQPNRPPTRTMQTIRGQRFEDETVEVDGKAFETCVFSRCVLQFSGAALTSLTGCSFIECQWRAIGAAENVIALLQGMYRDPGMRPLVEATFHGLGDGPAAPPGAPPDPSGGFNA